MTDTWFIFIVINYCFYFNVRIISYGIWLFQISGPTFFPSPDNTTTFIFLFPRRDIMKSQKKIYGLIWTISTHYTSWDCLQGDGVGPHIVSSVLLFSKKPTWLGGQRNKLDGPLVTNSSTRKTTVQFWDLVKFYSQI